MSVGHNGGVFVSYRREDGGDAAGRLADRLAERFGAGRVFMDVDAIEPGTDFAQAMIRAVEACDVLVAVIGPGWLAAANERGRRLDDPDDWVRMEVRTALTKGVLVIPVLVSSALMPSREDMPEDLAGLARRNALRVRHESFHADVGQLIAVIARVLASADPDTETAEKTVPSSDIPPRAGERDAGIRRGDPVRATRLFEEAESIAHSISYDSVKAPALSHVAAAAGDSDRANRLSGDAERIANSITDKGVRAKTLAKVVAAVAATAPDRAEGIANSIPKKTLRARALGVVAVAVAATDPDRAEGIANSIADKTSKTQALGAVAAAVAATDPDRAERIANSIADETSKAQALGAVAVAVAASDPDRADRLFTDAERIANSIILKSLKASTLGRVAAAVAASDPDRAERIARSITIDYWKAIALRDVVGPVAVIDPDRAERIAHSITNASLKAWALASIAKVLMSAT
jgi:hypothetical protein